MSKFYGNIGYGETVETSPGVWEDQIIIRPYYGDVIRNLNKWRKGENLNDNLIIDNRISVVADGFAYQKVYAMRYVEWMGSKWKIISAEVERPRIILSIGEVYNG